MRNSTNRHSRIRLLIVALVSLATFAFGVGTAGAVDATATGIPVDIAGGTITVSISGPYDGATLVAITSCGNAFRDGAMLTEAQATERGADICWGAESLATNPGKVLLVAVADGMTYEEEYEWDPDIVGVEDGTADPTVPLELECVEDGLVPCTMAVSALSGLTPVGDPVVIEVVPAGDGDGIVGDADNCVDVANPTQVDTDMDGDGDACDLDDDDDGVLDEVDNCRIVANADQIDADGDGIGAACDTDDTMAGRECDTDTETPFTDVPSDSFAADGVKCLYNLEVTTGTTDTTYAPGDDVTREQMAAFLARMYKAMTGEDAPIVEHPFTDVSDTSFAKDAVAQIYGLGITTGTSPTTYSPDATVTREQMAAFISRLYEVANETEAPVVDHPFTDVSDTSFAKDAIAKIYGLGITTGTSPTTYSPDGNVTREQMAAFLSRLYEAQ